MLMVVSHDSCIDGSVVITSDDDDGGVIGDNGQTVYGKVNRGD